MFLSVTSASFVMSVLGFIRLVDFTSFYWQRFCTASFGFFGSVSFLRKVEFSLCWEFAWQVVFTPVTFRLLLKFRLWLKSYQDGFGVRYQSSQSAFGECAQQSVHWTGGYAPRFSSLFFWLKPVPLKWRYLVPPASQ